MDHAPAPEHTYVGPERRNHSHYAVEVPATTWERHGQTILAAIVLLLLGWVGLTVQDNATGNAVMTTQLGDLKTKVTELEKTITVDVADRYKVRDAERDFRAVYDEINRIRTDNNNFMKEQASRGPRIGALETQLKELRMELDALKSKRGK